MKSLFTLCCMFVVSCIFVYAQEAEPQPEERKINMLKVNKDSVAVKLGKETLGYVAKNSTLRPKKMENGFYLVEVHVDGMFRSLGWVDADSVSVIQLPESKVTDKPAYAYPDLESLKAGKKNNDVMDQYEVTGYYSSEEPAPVTAGGVERKGPAKDETLVKEYRQFVGDSSEYGKEKIGADALPENLDVSKGVAPKVKPQDPIVSKELLPVIPHDERTEQTLGRGTAKFQVKTEQIVAALFVVGVVLIGIIYLVFTANAAKKKKFKLKLDS